MKLSQMVEQAKEDSIIENEGIQHSAEDLTTAEKEAADMKAEIDAIKILAGI